MCQTIVLHLPCFPFFPVSLDDAVQVFFYHISLDRMAAGHNRTLMKRRRKVSEICTTGKQVQSSCRGVFNNTGSNTCLICFMQQRCSDIFCPVHPIPVRSSIHNHIKPRVKYFKITNMLCLSSSSLLLKQLLLLLTQDNFHYR